MVASEGCIAAPDIAEDSHLLTGEQYKASLRDGRRVISADGHEIGDVTTHPALARGADTVGAFYDAQFAPQTRDITTYVDPETGKRTSLAWKVPRTKEDLRERRELIRFTTYQTLGVFGRPPDYGAWNGLGLLPVIDRIEGTNPEWAENVRRFAAYGRRRNWAGADVVADVQSDRSVPVSERPGRLRCVEERPDGLVLYGGRPVASVAAQAHFVSVRTTLSPGIDPDAALFCALPVNTDGLMLVLREPVTSPDSSREDHPLDSHGEEADAFLVFDHVFVPNERVFSFRNTELLALYHEIGALALWNVLTRLAYRAEIFAGTAQLIIDVLGTGSIPQVRDAVAEVVAYERTLKAFVLASEEEAESWNGVMVPAEKYVTPGRLHSIVHYPRIMQLLRELSGQGLISRFTQAQLERDDLGGKLEEFLPGSGVSARAKNQVFNFVWDLTSGSHAMRVALFENVNATPAAAMRARIYNVHDRSAWTKAVRDYIGLVG